MKLNKLEVLVDSPFVFVQVWINVIVPSLTALLAYAPRQKVSDLFPVFKTELFDLLLEQAIFVRCPVALDLLGPTFILHVDVICVISKELPSFSDLLLGLCPAEIMMLVSRYFLFSLIDEFIEKSANHFIVLTLAIKIVLLRYLLKFVVLFASPVTVILFLGVLNPESVNP